MRIDTRATLLLVIGILAIAGSPTTSGQAVSGQDSWELPLLSFGAKCDGQTNDGPAIQRAFDAARRVSGTVIWPARTCATSVPLTLGGDRDRSSFISIRGATPDASALRWIGPSNGIA